MFEPPFLSFDIFEVGMYIFKVRDYLIVDHSQNHVVLSNRYLELGFSALKTAN